MGAHANRMWARPLYVGTPPTGGLILKPKVLFSFFVLIYYIGCLCLQIQIQHQCLDVRTFDLDGGNRRLLIQCVYLYISCSRITLCSDLVLLGGPDFVNNWSLNLVNTVCVYVILVGCYLYSIPGQYKRRLYRSFNMFNEAFIGQRFKCSIKTHNKLI